MITKPLNNSHSLPVNPTIHLLRNCYEWIKTHFLTVITTLALVFVFIHYESVIVEVSFSIINETIENLWGQIILWSLLFCVSSFIIYDAIKTIRHNKLNEGYLYFLSLVLCVLFIYCAIKYPWGILKLETNNPIAGYEWVPIALFGVWTIRALIIPLILYYKNKNSVIEDFFKWLKTYFLTILFTIGLVFVFLFFENEIVRASFLFISKITESHFGNILLWGVGILVIAAIIYNAIIAITQKKLSDGRTYFLSFVLCCLFIHCTIKYPWESLKLDTDNPIAGYEWTLGLLFAIYVLESLIIPLVLFFIVKHRTNTYRYYADSIQAGRYLIDTPITSIENDKLHFNEHVEALKNQIDEIPISGSHSIAVTGGWGTGKTSFLNLLQQKLNTQNKYEVIWFNPMKSSKSGNIQNDFFDVLENTLSKYKTGFGRRINYYKELIGAIDNKYISFLIKLGSIHLEEEKKRINDTIKKIPKRIIIIIDDVDRLKGDEIMQIFRLVGFNAEFDNVVFLLALDKKNVIEALGCNVNYPDKFFEMEFPLPDNNRNTISRFVKNTMAKLLPEIQMDFMVDRNISEYTAYCISNLRDANRFINGFVERFKMINDKLDNGSYYILSLIQYKDSILYEKIKTMDKNLLETKEESEMQYWVLKESGCSELDDTLKHMLIDLFSKERESSTKHYIYQPEFFLDYFNETSTRTITDKMMNELLSSESEDVLIQKLKQYTNNDISKQIMINKMFEKNKEDYMSSLLNNNHSDSLIINYYIVLGYLNIIDKCLTFSEGLASIQIKWGEYAYINKQGKVVFKIECDSAQPFSEGLAKINKYIKNYKSGFINKEGKLIIPLIYDEAGSFHEGLVQVKKGHKWGFVNKEGDVVVSLIYDGADSFNEGLARVAKDGKYGFVNKEGKIVIPIIYEKTGFFYEGLARVLKNGRWGFVDKNGVFVIPFEYDFAGDFQEGLVSVQKDGKFGVIDKNGEIIKPFVKNNECDFHEGLARVIKDGKWGFIDKERKIVVPFIYDSVGNFHEGLARVTKDGKWGLINKEGMITVPLIYDNIQINQEGLSCVKKDEKYGFIDNDGTIIIPLIFDDARDFHENLACVKINGKYGFIDKTGNAIIPTIYDDARSFLKGQAHVIKDGIMGVIDNKGYFTSYKTPFKKPTESGL